jgi:fatty acid desaturase
LKKRTFLPLSIFAALVAFAFQIAARNQIETNYHLKATRLAAYAAQRTLEVPSPEEVESGRNISVFNIVSLVFGIISIGLLVAAGIRHEPGWYLIPIMFLLLAAMTAMLL